MTDANVEIEGNQVMRHVRLLAVGVGLVAAAGLANDATPFDGGFRPVVVAVPPEAPRGAVELVSFGLVELTPISTHAITALHVRMSIRHATDDVPWTADLRATRIEVTHTPIAPLLLNSNLPSLPIAIIDPGEARVVDLYFALPAAVKTIGDLESFDMSWELATPDRRLVTRTQFTRDHRPSSAALIGAGLFWWFDPRYAWSTYYQRPGRIVPRPPASVVVTVSQR
jgi:hypothetical protein